MVLAQGSALPAWMKFDQEKLKVTGVPPKPEEWIIGMVVGWWGEVMASSE